MSTIIYTITLQVLRLSVTCLIMFFVREHCVKVVAVILLVSACSVHGEPPIHSSYLPPKQDEQSRTQFSTSAPTLNNFNSNFQPIETSISFTTNEPIRSFISSSVPTSGSIVDPLSKGYNQGVAQRVAGENKGYFYQPPSPTFGVPGDEGTRSPNQPEALTNSVSLGTSNSYFNINEGYIGSSLSVSSTYGVPNGGNTPSPGSNINFQQSANNASPTSYRPSINTANFNALSTLHGAPSNPQGTSSWRKEQHKSSSSYQTPDAQFQPQFSSLEQSNVGNNGYPFDTNRGVPQTSYRPPSTFPKDKNSVSAVNMVSPSTSYELPGNSFSLKGVSQGFTPQVPGGTVQKPFASFAMGSQNSPNEERPSPSSSYSQPSNSPIGGYSHERPSSSYGPPSLNSPIKQNQTPQLSYRPFSSNSPESQFNQEPQNQAQSSSSYNTSQNSRDIGYNRNNTSQVRPSSSYSPSSSNSPNNVYSQDVRNQGRPSSSFLHSAPSSGTSQETGYNVATENQRYASPSSSYGLPQTPLGNEYSQQRPNEGSLFSSNSRPFNNLPISSYGPPLSEPNSPSSQFGSGKSSSSTFYQPSLNQFQVPSKPGQQNIFLTSRPQDSFPGSTFGGSNFPNKPNTNAPLGTFSSSQSNSPANLFEQGFSSSSFPSFSSSPTASGFGGNLSPTYGTPISNGNNAFTSDKSSSFNKPSIGTTPSASGQFFNDDRKPSLEYGTPPNQGILQSNARPYDSTYNRNPLENRQPSGSPNDFTGGENSLINPTFSTNFGTGNTSPGQDSFENGSASSYLPPSYDPTGFPSSVPYPSITSPQDSLIPSTSYTLPSGEPNTSKERPSNVLKNANRNVGSDLITGASTSPFKPFKDDNAGIFNGTNTPSRASYEKSNEVINNDISSTGTDSSEPASYEFNYNVKQADTEFNHQESRNGNTTSGSYGVVLPDGRKQVVDYEANQEGFHPKIRYEENTRSSPQQNQDTVSKQNTAFSSPQNEGYNYSPNFGSQEYSRPQGTNTSPTSFNDLGSSPQYNQELQPPYPNSPNYNQGNFDDNQDSYSPQLQSSASNFNTYKNQGTSPSNQYSSFSPPQSEENTGSSSPYNSDQNSPPQFDTNSQGYNYNPNLSSNVNNAVTVYDSSSDEGYPRELNIKNGAKQVPFFT